MASYTATKGVTKTLTANTADTVTLTGTGMRLRIANLDKATGTGYAIYVGVATTGNTPPTAGDNATDCFAIPNSQAIEIPWPGTGAVISVWSANNTEYNAILM